MKKILVVDDDLDILLLMETMLSMHHFKVEAIARWQDINSSIVNFKPDLILLDVSLGGADGRDICKKLKQEETTQYIPIVLFSANAEMGNNIEKYHAQAFVSKPFQLTHLLQTIRSNLA